MTKDRMDAFGTVSLTVFSALLAFNQVMVKVGTEGFQPVFMAGARSAGALACLLLWMWFRGLLKRAPNGTLPWNLFLGLLFSAEFLLLFTALDQTTVVRTSVIFYSMPLWAALMVHFGPNGDRLTGWRVVGLIIAFLGVAIAIVSRDGGNGAQAPSLSGDLCALGAALCWAGIAFVVRATPASQSGSHTQLMWQLGVSAILLLVVAPMFGPLLRSPEPMHWAALAFQVFVVAFAGFLFWLWILARYPTTMVVSFSFLAPIFGVLLGWALLNEPLGPSVMVALTFLVLGLILINRPART